MIQEFTNGAITLYPGSNGVIITHNVKAYSTLKHVNFSSSGCCKITIAINNKDMITMLGLAGNQNHISLNLNLEPSDIIVINATNLDKHSCVLYATLIHEEDSKRWFRKFEQEMEATIAD